MIGGELDMQSYQEIADMYINFMNLSEVLYGFEIEKKHKELIMVFEKETTGIIIKSNQAGLEEIFKYISEVSPTIELKEEADNLLEEIKTAA